MEILVLIIFLVVVITYLFVGYKFYKNWHKIAVWEMFLVALIPFWGCIVYLIIENYRWKESRKRT